MSANPLNQLLEAENQVSRQIQQAEANARQRIQKADVDADTEYGRLKDEEEKKFQAEERQIAGQGDASVAAVIQKIEQEKQQQQQSFKASEAAVIDLLLHQVTTCDVQLNESQKQAFLAIKRNKEAAAAAEF